MGRGSTVLDVRAFPDRADDRHVSHFVTHGLYQTTTTVTSSLRRATCNRVLERLAAPPSCLRCHCREFGVMDIEISSFGRNDNILVAPISARAAGCQTARAVIKNRSEHLGRIAEQTRLSVQNASSASTTRSFWRTSSFYRTSEDDIASNSSAQSRHLRTRSFVGREDNHYNTGSFRMSGWFHIVTRTSFGRAGNEQHLHAFRCRSAVVYDWDPQCHTRQVLRARCFLPTHGGFPGA
jgi:hypothetical protein